MLEVQTSDERFRVYRTSVEQKDEDASVTTSALTQRSTAARPHLQQRQLEHEQTAVTSPPQQPQQQVSAVNTSLAELKAIIDREQLPVKKHVGGAARRTKADIARDIDAARAARGARGTVPGVILHEEPARDAGDVEGGQQPPTPPTPPPQLPLLPPPQQPQQDQQQWDITAAERFIAALPSWPFVGGEEERECAVCLNAFQTGTTIRALLCDHQFHAACIDTWLLARRERTTCPVCNTVVSSALFDNGNNDER